MMDVEKDKSQERNFGEAFHSSIIKVIPGSMANYVPQILSAHNASINLVVKKYKSTKEKLRSSNLLVEHYKSLCHQLDEKPIEKEVSINYHSEREKVMKEYIEILEAKCGGIAKDLAETKERCEMYSQENSCLKRTLSSLKNELKETSVLVGREKMKTQKAEENLRAAEKKIQKDHLLAKDLEYSKWKNEIKEQEEKKVSLDLAKFAEVKQQSYMLQSEVSVLKKEKQRIEEEKERLRDEFDAKVESIESTFLKEKRVLEEASAFREKEYRKEIHSLKDKIAAIKTERVSIHHDSSEKTLNLYDAFIKETKLLDSKAPKGYPKSKIIDFLTLLSHQIHSVRLMITRTRIINAEDIEQAESDLKRNLVKVLSAAVKARGSSSLKTFGTEVKKEDSNLDSSHTNEISGSNLLDTEGQNVLSKLSKCIEAGGGCTKKQGALTNITNRYLSNGSENRFNKGKS